MSNATNPQLPNPLTPLAFFPPEAARQATVFFYVSVGSLSVLIWDVLNNLKSDYKIMVDPRVCVRSRSFFLPRSEHYMTEDPFARLSAAPIGNCHGYASRQSWLYPFSMSTTALLFLIRVYAIYNRNKYVSGAFFIAWLGVIAGTATIPISSRAKNIGTTAYCFVDASSIPVYWTAAGIVVLFFDTAVYLAISWRLMCVFHVGRSVNGFKRFFMGEGLPLFSRGLFQDGQVYYFQIIMNIMACRLAPQTTREMITHAAVAIEFGRSQDHTTSDIELGAVDSASKRLSP
ncbi:hypothetical protein CVT25_011944 [Psilocybe cyanescens]|uniref:Uncharacterized protein n=1 Tax=Psilocybe cyanescens TaxID=93625 RepID=A0A409XQR5_PSICY|nr:hypothetical protein CVT25_011944 [Psilocybe cyanescens]